MAKCAITDNQFFNEIRVVKEAGGNVDILAAHMQGLKSYPVTDTTDVGKYWKEKYTAFRAKMSATEKAYRKLGGDKLVVANHLKDGLALTKLGAPVKKKSEDVWAEIGNMAAAWKTSLVKDVETPEGSKVNA